MSRTIERWEAGRVDRSGEHFELSASAEARDDDRNSSPVAVIGPPHEGIVPVEVLVERSDVNAALIAKVETEISYYLLELDEADPWAYAQHHCGTTSNLYSDVHWSYFDGSQAPLEVGQAGELSIPVEVEAQGVHKDAALIIDRFYERDIDMMLAEELQVSPDFANWFLSSTNCASGEAGKVLEVAVSKSDNVGESDLVVLFESVDSKSRFALFIEDKITAPLQPEQLARYRMRAENGRQRGFYSHYHVVLCSPEGYQNQSDAEGFDAYVSYESIAAFLREADPVGTRNLYREAIFAKVAATYGNRGGQKKERDPQTDSFWQAAYDIALREFPELGMRPPNFVGGTTWISLRPYELPKKPRLIVLDLKGANGFADLTFSGILSTTFAPLIAPLLEDGMSVENAGGSTVVRLRIPSFRISEFDSAAEEHLRSAFAACTRLLHFYRKNRPALDLAASHSLPEPLAPNFGHRAGRG